MCQGVTKLIQRLQSLDDGGLEQIYVASLLNQWAERCLAA